ncbi:MAG: TonB-dependent receptor [Prevotellaceae bacterium]|jgi:TonB-linked SusC/RagA family outer membrane protein|nr:TonB-dependent receptor [Prevotellaceae bacterium]
MKIIHCKSFKFTRISILLALLGILSIQPVFSQSGTVTGLVRDDSGAPLQGVSVTVKGTNNGVVSDINGKYVINNVSGDAVLSISFLGFVTEEITVGSQTVINVTLQESTQELDEIVVIGYGAVRKRDLTGSVTSIRSEEIAKVNLPSLNHILKTQMPIDVRPGGLEPGSNPAIEIRGNNVLNSNISNNNPLWVVDGVPMQSSSMVINPYDIVSVDILQDASAAAIYGSRGANGVIIVTTKQAQVGAEKTSVTYNGWAGFDKVTRRPKLMNGEQFTAYKRAAWFNSGNLSSIGDATLEKTMQGDYDGQIFDAMQQEAIERGVSTDWYGLVYGGTAFNMNHNLTVSTSGKVTGTVISLGYLTQESLVPYAGYDRYNLNFSNKLKPSKRVEFTTKILGTYSKNDHATGAVDLLYQLTPLASPYDKDGNPQLYVGTDAFETNPVMEAENSLNEVFEYNIIGSTAMKWNIWDNLNYEVALRADYANSDNGRFDDVMTLDRQGTKPPAARYQKNTILATTFDNILSYNKAFAKIHRIDAMVAFNTENYQNKELMLRTEDMSFDGLYYNMGTASTVLEKGSKLTEWTIMSFMGRVNYSLLDRYLLTATFRRDGSSRLPTGNKWTQYPAFAVSWLLGEEPFMAALKDKFLDNLKLRLSYGNVGKMSIAPYSTLGALGGPNWYAFDNTPVKGYIPNTIPNTNLVWEKTTEYNLGIDFSIYKGRLSGTIDLYDKYTDGLIMPRNLPYTSGFASYQMNIGKINNSGVQVTLRGDIIRNDDFVWNMGITFYKNRNKIVDLYGDKQDDVGSSWFIGQPIRVYYGYDMVGVWQEEEADAAAVYGAQPGWPKLLDVTNEEPDKPAIRATEDRVIIPTDPKWIGSLNTSLAYKGIDLYVNIYTRQGSRGGSSEYQTGEPGRRNVIQEEFWTPENRSNEHPFAYANGAFKTGGPNNSENGLGDYALFDLSYIRLANVSLGYTLPVKFTQKFSVSNARFFMNISNPYVYAPKYKGNDPENTGRGYPMVTAYQFGLNLSF